MPNITELIGIFVVLWAVIDPIGTVPVFISSTTGKTEEECRKIARIAASAAAGILLFFAIVGELLLVSMGVPLLAFQISGGLVLFLFSLTMIFGESKPEEEVRVARSVEDTAIFPLATPSIASPGAMMAVVLLTENSRFSIFQQIWTVVVMLAVVGCAYVLMVFAGKITKFIGPAGAGIVSRVMGMILASVAATHVLEGLKQYFG